MHMCTCHATPHYATHARMRTHMCTHMWQWEEHCVEYNTVQRRQTRINTERAATALAEKGLVPGDFGMIQVAPPCPYNGRCCGHGPLKF